jgi:hypothetical protein
MKRGKKRVMPDDQGKGKYPFTVMREQSSDLGA